MFGQRLSPGNPAVRAIWRADLHRAGGNRLGPALPGPAPFGQPPIRPLVLSGRDA